MTRKRFWYDSDLHRILSTMSVTGHTADQVEGETRITINAELDPRQLWPLIDSRQDYLAVAHDTEPDFDAVAAYIAEEVGTALNIEFNTIGHANLSGEYQRVNDTQWKQQDATAAYNDYQDLLYELTGRDVDFNEETPSIPGLYRPFLEVVANSPDHDLPEPGAVQEIISEHIQQLRYENQARGATAALKRELEGEGIDARTAARVSQKMEPFFAADADLDTGSK